MTVRRIGRIILAIVAAYLANILLVATTELLAFFFLGHARAMDPPMYYFVGDLVTQVSVRFLPPMLPAK